MGVLYNTELHLAIGGHPAGEPSLVGTLIQVGTALLHDVHRHLVLIVRSQHRDIVAAPSGDSASTKSASSIGLGDLRYVRSASAYSLRRAAKSTWG